MYIKRQYRFCFSFYSSRADWISISFSIKFYFNFFYVSTYVVRDSTIEIPVS